MAAQNVQPKSRSGLSLPDPACCWLGASACVPEADTPGNPSRRRRAARCRSSRWLCRRHLRAMSRIIGWRFFLPVVVMGREWNAVVGIKPVEATSNNIPAVLSAPGIQNESARETATLIRRHPAVKHWCIATIPFASRSLVDRTIPSATADTSPQLLLFVISCACDNELRLNGVIRRQDGTPSNHCPCNAC